MENPLIRVSFLIGLGDYMEELGVSSTQVLERAGLDEEQIRDPSNFMPLEKHCAVLEEAAHATGNPALMVEFTGRQSLGIFGAIGALAMGSTDVRGGLEVFQRYLHYSVQALEVNLKVEHDTVFITLHTDFPPSVQSTKRRDDAAGDPCTRSLMLSSSMTG